MTFITSSASVSEAGFMARLSALVAPFREYFRVQRSISELRGLSAESLRDIGIERAEIERIVRYGR